ncbi:hypothetical protein QP028_11395 [Corynebacterium suedekumii]|nr:hypothetical protein QP028_11395 [Corynebacterium suedekumii]
MQLAFAFVAMLGTQGMVTGWIESIAPGAMAEFSITGFLGVTIVYLYFQVPLMAILMLPAMGGVKKAWYEAAASLGASKFQYASRRRRARPVALDHRLAAAAVRQRLRRLRHRLRAGGRVAEPGAHRHRLPHQRQRPAQPGTGRRPGHVDDDHHPRRHGHPIPADQKE